MRRNRTWVIGDIHGALRALKQLIGKLEVQSGDQLIFLGDYVDGWSESAGVIDYLLLMEQVFQCIFIKGNHDVYCHEWLLGGAPGKAWISQGGLATMESYTDISLEDRPQHIAFFDRLRDYYIDDQNRLFIHAGYSSIHGPAQEPYESNYIWDRTLWEMAEALDERISPDSKLYPKRLQHFREIYLGHTPTIQYDVMIPMRGGNVWNVDTGAAYFGRLSALEINTKECWQSDIVQQFYPNEKGRNS